MAKQQITLHSGQVVDVDELVCSDAYELVKEYYTDYAMYLIQARALPNIYDGLKPAQRRLIFVANDVASSKFTKSSKVLGFTLVYHPHAIDGLYTALIGITTNNTTFKLFNGKGNWGAFDCPPAAFRYTECYLNEAGHFGYTQFLNCSKYVVGESGLDEPLALPALIPYCMIAGASGIGVGLSTNIMPLNIMELIDYYINTIKKKPVKIPTPDVGNYVLDMEDSEIDDTVSKIDSRLRIRSVIVQESSNTLVIEGSCGKSISRILDSIGDLLDSGKVDFRDESKTELRYVISIEDNLVDMQELTKKLVHQTTTNQSFTRLVYDGDKAIYCNLAYQVKKSLEYLNKCLDDKFKREVENYQNLIKKLEVIKYIKASGLLKQLDQMTSTELKDKLFKTGKFDEDSIKAACASSITYLTKSHDKELIDIQNKIKEINNINREDYLVDLYEKFREIVRPQYESKRHTIRRSQLLTKPRVKLSKDKKSVVISNEGEVFKNSILVVLSNGYVCPMNTYSQLKRTVDIKLEDNEEVVNIVPDWAGVFAVITNKDRILSREFSSITYNRQIVNLDEGEKVTSVFKSVVDKNGSAIVNIKGKHYDLSNYIKKRLSAPIGNWRNNYVS